MAAHGAVRAAPTSVWALHPEFASLSTTTTTYYAYTLVTRKDPSEDTTASDSDNTTLSPTTPVALELVCVTPDTTPATVTVTGETIPDWYAIQAAQLRSLPFSLKYAWMLEQMAASYDSRSGFTVARDQLLEQSLAFLMQLPPNELCSTTRVTMAGEDALDAGGVQREWYTVLAHAHHGRISQAFCGHQHE